MLKGHVKTDLDQNVFENCLTWWCRNGKHEMLLLALSNGSSFVKWPIWEREIFWPADQHIKIYGEST